MLRDHRTMGCDDIHLIREALDWFYTENVRTVTRRKNPAPLTDELSAKIEHLRRLAMTFKAFDEVMGSEIEFIL